MFAQSFGDQFAFRPTGSTTCALINLNHIIADLLQTHPYVHLIALDFSKAFDTVRHSTLLDKCRRFPLLDLLYNWLAKYLEGRQHVTKFGGMLSDLRRITASIVQGSGIGPTAFVLTASDLRTLSLLIFLNKYADDCYLIVPPDQASHISSELVHIEKWAQDNNLKLNVLKTKEMIVRRPKQGWVTSRSQHLGSKGLASWKFWGCGMRTSRSGDTSSRLSPNATKVYMRSGHSWPKGSVVPIFGMSPRQPLCQGSHMRALPGGECLMRAVDNIFKHCSQNL